MGEAKTLIEGSPSETSEDPESVLGKLDIVLDEIDSAIQIKIADLFSEPREKKAENHYKIGMMRAADTLVRRAVCLLQDCYEPLDAAEDFLSDTHNSSEQDNATDA